MTFLGIVNIVTKKFIWIRFHWTVFDLSCFALKSYVCSTTVSLWTGYQLKSSMIFSSWSTYYTRHRIPYWVIWCDQYWQTVGHLCQIRFGRKLSASTRSKKNFSTSTSDGKTSLYQEDTSTWCRKRMRWTNQISNSRMQAIHSKRSISCLQKLIFKKKSFKFYMTIFLKFYMTIFFQKVHFGYYHL